MSQEAISLKQTIAGNIRRLRLKKDVTATKMAEELGVSQTTVSDWERAQKMPRAGSIEKLAAYFNVAKSDILSELPEGKRAREIAAQDIIDFEALLESGTRLVHSGRVISEKERAIIRAIVQDIIKFSQGGI